MAQTQFSVIKKIKIGRPEHLLPTTPLRLTISYFCLPPRPPPTPQSERHMCIIPYIKNNIISRVLIKFSVYS